MQIAIGISKVIKKQDQLRRMSAKQFHITSFFRADASPASAAERRARLFAAEADRDRRLLAEAQARAQARRDTPSQN